MKHSGGFTLLELLVVISIIGLLSSIVLSSLNSARGQAAKSAVDQQVSQMMKQSAVEHITTGNFAPSVVTPGWASQVSDCDTIANFEFNSDYQRFCNALVQDSIANDYGPFFMTVDTDGEMVVAAALGGDTYTCQRGRSRVAEFTMASDTDWPSACDPIGTAYASGGGGGGGSSNVLSVRFNATQITTNSFSVDYFEIGPDGGSPWSLSNATANGQYSGFSPTNALTNNNTPWMHTVIPSWWQADVAGGVTVTSGDTLRFTIDNMNGTYWWQDGSIDITTDSGTISIDFPDPMPGPGGAGSQFTQSVTVTVP